MGTVHYKFTYNSDIDFPDSIDFNGIEANTTIDNKGNFIIEGEVKDVELDEENQLPVYVSSSGRTGRTWQLEVLFDSKKLEIYPIEGTIGNNGFCTINKRYKLQP